MKFFTSCSIREKPHNPHRARCIRTRKKKNEHIPLPMSTTSAALKTSSQSKGTQHRAYRGQQTRTAHTKQDVNRPSVERCTSRAQHHDWGEGRAAARVIHSVSCSCRQCCTPIVVATHRHVDRWPQTTDHTKRATQTCLGLVVVFVGCWLLVVGCCGCGCGGGGCCCGGGQRGVYVDSA